MSRQAVMYRRSDALGPVHHTKDCPIKTAGVCTCGATIECPPGWVPPPPIDCKKLIRPIRPMVAHTSLPPDCSNPDPERYFRLPPPEVYDIQTNISCTPVDRDFEETHDRRTYRCRDLRETVEPGCRLTHTHTGRISNFRVNNTVPPGQRPVCLDAPPPFNEVPVVCCPHGSKPIEQQYVIQHKTVNGTTYYDCTDPIDTKRVYEATRTALMM